MKVILEGPDNSGKTTLAGRLVRDLELGYMRPPSLSSTEGVNDHVFTWWEQELTLHEHRTAVYDRCTYISDPIYRLVSGHTPLRPAWEMMRGIGQVKQQAYLVFCLPDWQFVKPMLEREIAEGGGLKHLDIAHAEIVHWAYFTAYRLWSLIMPERVSVWNFEAETLPEATDLQYNSILHRIREAI